MTTIKENLLSAHIEKNEISLFLSSNQNLEKIFGWFEFNTSEQRKKKKVKTSEW